MCATGKAADSFPSLCCPWAAKHTSGWCAVSCHMLQWKKWDPSTCPCCHQSEETARHIDICPDTRIQEKWEEELDGSEAWLEEHETHPDVIQCIMQTLRARMPTSQFSANVTNVTLQAASMARHHWMAQPTGRLNLKTVARNPTATFPTDQVPLVLHRVGKWFCDGSTSDHPCHVDSTE